jgi:O-methyltransferase
MELLLEDILKHEGMFPGDPPDRIRLHKMFEYLQVANKLGGGHYIELGVHLGLTLRFIYRYMDKSQRLYAFDTFKGFNKDDIAIESSIYTNHWRPGNFHPTSSRGVASYVGDGAPPENLRVIAGPFPRTFKGYEKVRWRFAHIDMDLYAPTEAALDILWPRMVPGGIIMVHDYGVGGFRVHLAVDRFCEKNGVSMQKLADRWGTAVMVKDLC